MNFFGFPCEHDKKYKKIMIGINKTTRTKVRLHINIIYIKYVYLFLIFYFLYCGNKNIYSKNITLE